MNRVCMAAGVAVANGHTDQGHRLRTGVKTFRVGMKRLLASAESPEIRPMGSDLSGFHGDERRRVASDESLRQVMYMNCWGQV